MEIYPNSIYYSYKLTYSRPAVHLYLSYTSLISTFTTPCNVFAFHSNVWFSNAATRPSSPLYSYVPTLSKILAPDKMLSTLKSLYVVLCPQYLVHSINARLIHLRINFTKQINNHPSGRAFWTNQLIHGASQIWESYRLLLEHQNELGCLQYLILSLSILFVRESCYLLVRVARSVGANWPLFKITNQSWGHIEVFLCPQGISGTNLY